MDLWHPQTAADYLMTNKFSDQEKYYHNNEETEALGEKYKK